MYTNFAGLSKYYLFKYDTLHCGATSVQYCAGGNTKQVTMAKLHFNNGTYGPINFPRLPIKGTNVLKQCDLHTKVRPFIPVKYQEELCLEPLTQIVLSVTKTRKISAKHIRDQLAAKRKRTV